MTIEKQTLITCDDSEGTDGTEMLRKHVALVHSYSSISLLQRKMVNILLHRAYRQLSDSQDYWFEIPIGDIREILQYTGKNWAWIREAGTDLMTTAVEYDLLGDCGPPVSLQESPRTKAGPQGGRRTGRVVWQRSILFPNIEVLDTGVLRYQINPAIAPRIFKPEIYALLDMSLQCQFRTKYGHALYETVVRFRSTRSTGYIEMEVWRKLLGVAEGTYSKFNEFKRNVLVPALEDINKFGCLNVKAELRQSGRKVTAMRVLIEDEPPQGEPVQPGPTGQRLVQALSKKGVAVSEANKLIKDIPSAYIQTALDELLHFQFNTSGPANPGGWLVARARKLYEAAPKATPRRTRSKTSNGKKSEEKVESNPVVATVEEQMARVPEPERERVWQSFRDQLNTAEQGMLQRSKGAHIAVRVALKKFLQSQGY